VFRTGELWRSVTGGDPGRQCGIAGHARGAVGGLGRASGPRVDLEWGGAGREAGLDDNQAAAQRGVPGVGTHLAGLVSRLMEHAVC
jgi:hypothetical protein